MGVPFLESCEHAIKQGPYAHSGRGEDDKVQGVQGGEEAYEARGPKTNEEEFCR